MRANLNFYPISIVDVNLLVTCAPGRYSWYIYRTRGRWIYRQSVRQLVWNQSEITSILINVSFHNFALSVLVSLPCSVQNFRVFFFFFLQLRKMLWTNEILHDFTLTQWGRDKMAAVSQTTFSNAFSLMKIYEFRLRFHWNLFLRFELKIFQHWFR